MNERPADHPSLILIRGLPGSGKSHLAAALTEHFGPDNVTILDPDQIDKTSEAYTALCKTLTEEGVDPILFPNRFLKAKGYEAIDAGRIIIWNQAFTHPDGFDRSVGSLKEYAAQHETELTILLVEVEVSPEVARQRASERAGQGGHAVPDQRFEQFISEYRSFADKGYPTVRVNGEDDVQRSANTVLAALGKLWKS
jgi:predicted kinase